MSNKELSQAAKKYFSQIRKTDRLIQRLTDTVTTLRSGLCSQNYELKPDKVQSSGTKDVLGETMVKIMSLEEDINARIDELVSMKKEAFSMISKIPDFDQQNVLVGRYIQIKDWEDIVNEFDREIRWVYRLHNEALVAFMSVNDSL